MNLRQTSQRLLMCVIVIGASALVASGQAAAPAPAHHGAPHDPQVDAAFGHFYNMEYDRATPNLRRSSRSVPTIPSR